MSETHKKVFNQACAHWSLLIGQIGQRNERLSAVRWDLKMCVVHAACAQHSSDVQAVLSGVFFYSINSLWLMVKPPGKVVGCANCIGLQPAGRPLSDAYDKTHPLDKHHFSVLKPNLRLYPYQYDFVHLKLRSLEILLDPF